MRFLACRFVTTLPATTCPKRKQPLPDLHLSTTSQSLQGHCLQLARLQVWEATLDPLDHFVLEQAVALAAVDDDSIHTWAQGFRSAGELPNMYSGHAIAVRDEVPAATRARTRSLSLGRVPMAAATRRPLFTASYSHSKIKQALSAIKGMKLLHPDLCRIGKLDILLDVCSGDHGHQQARLGDDRELALL